MNIYFDRDDHRLLEVINGVLDRELDHEQFKTLLTPYLRPHGIKELAAGRGIRIAYAITHLLGSLESDRAMARMTALTALRDEVLTAARSNMRINRARVLVQIVKELTRTRMDREAQLRLAHDFHRAATGNTRFLRRQLQKYHLLEMPEQWNQVSFDDRVHDANSKGRKSATHLIMDAWIKGIRQLRVVYYDFVDEAVVSELMTAARIMGITVRIGIEFRAVFRERFVKIIWEPGELHEQSDIKGYFRDERVRRLMALGREAQQFRSQYVLEALEAFNTRHRWAIEQEFGVRLPPIDPVQLMRAVGTGQLSLLHLGKHIHDTALPLFEARTRELARTYVSADYDEKASIAMHVESLNALDADTIVARYLEPEANPDLRSPDLPCQGEDCPELLGFSVAELVERLSCCSQGSRLTLILAELSLEDVVEILFDCQGAITDLEMFNLKNMTEQQVHDRSPMSRLQCAINDENTYAMKRIVQGCFDAVRASQTADKAQRLEKFATIQQDFHRLGSLYRHHKLGTHIGSGSTGSSSRAPGMGFAVVSTLPLCTQRALSAKHFSRLPLAENISQTLEFFPPQGMKGRPDGLLARVSRLPGLRLLLCTKVEGWRVSGLHVEETGAGDVVTLGGIRDEADNGLRLFEERHEAESGIAWPYLNTRLVNVCKILLGFIPAFLTFYLTKEWWVLAYLGGFIWFAITGVRNVIQSVLGGGGLSRSKYLRWSEFVSWSRVADSLLYTGFSVPLLDYFCKTVLLERGLGITTASNSLALYSIMALTNGLYISSHNLFRGLPREAVLGNFFRSVLSIPIALAFNAGLALLLVSLGVQGVDGVLQLWAAVISKLASDCVAGIIEGLADMKRNIAMRRWDYANKLKQVYETFSELEILFPALDVATALKSPGECISLLRKSNAHYVHILIANALDLLYFMCFQPRAAEALLRAVRDMSPEEKDILYSSQLILSEEKEVARLFVDGLVGGDFSRALSFYLLNQRSYLQRMQRMLAA